MWLSKDNNLLGKFELSTKYSSVNSIMKIAQAAGPDSEVVSQAARRANDDEVSHDQRSWWAVI